MQSGSVQVSFTAAGAQALEPFLLFLEVQQPGLEPALTWDTGAAGSSSTSYAMVLVPPPALMCILCALSPTL